MEGHAAMDMSVTGSGPFWRRLVSSQGFTSTSRLYVMNWASVIVDVAGGLVIAGCLAAWVPDSFWRRLFFTGHPLAAEIWGPLIGPAISLVAFVCSIGNVPLAAVLWNGGMSFGGVISFIFADLIIVPILLIYRKYYGTAMALRLFAVFYATMTVAGSIVEAVFDPLASSRPPATSLRCSLISRSTAIPTSTSWPSFSRPCSWRASCARAVAPCCP
jgi:uncharacterized membrane protein YraQ (UPF0718 family)